MSTRANRPAPSTLSRRSLIAGTALAATARIGEPAGAQTPAAGDEDDFAARIGALLAVAPAREIADADSTPLYYADLAGQLASVEVERPDASGAISTLPDGFFEATIALPLAARAFEIGLDPRWFPTFGFYPYAVGQALMLGTVDNPVAIYRGGVDGDGVKRALTASGFVEVRRKQGAYLSYGDEVDVETTVGQLAFGTMNQAIVDDDLLVFAGQERSIEAVLAVLAGDAPSMASSSSLVARFSPDIVGLIRIPPAALSRPGGGATPVSRPVTLVELAMGVRAGSRSAPLMLGGEGTPMATPAGGPDAVPARVEARLRYADAASAAREATDIPARWRAATSIITDAPFDELMTIAESGVSPADPTVVAVDFIADTPNRWSQLVATGDLSPFLPAG
jgi:hypothetical protein